ncbi:hypothetical protein Salat_0634600 [Sesamum alatum]|uniref:Uncharacterized protein n=1 Tax=Sesamum alatum TaxID=300844 RepID=A0AAE2CUA8_9LAMI|nr:hypothetical protein Salat_0634600 [Sesamum alatum]
MAASLSAACRRPLHVIVGPRRRGHDRPDPGRLLCRYPPPLLGRLLNGATVARGAVALDLGDHAQIETPPQQGRRLNGATSRFPFYGGTLSPLCVRATATLSSPPLCVGDGDVAVAQYGRRRLRRSHRRRPSPLINIYIYIYF